MPSSVLQIFGVGTALLAGYIFIRFSPYRRMKAEQLRTDRFTLLVVGYALIFYLLGLAVSLYVDETMLFGKWVMKVSKLTYKEGIPPTVLYACVLALLGAGADRLWILFCMRKHASVRENKGESLGNRVKFAAVAMYIRKSEDVALRTLYRAFFWRKSLMVTMKSGKVYIGTPLYFFDPCEFATSLRLFPVSSGYRDPVTKKVTIATPYDNLQEKLVVSDEEAEDSRLDYTDPLLRDDAQLQMDAESRVSIDLEDIGVVLMWSEIEYFTIHDENIARVFKVPSPPAPPPPPPRRFRNRLRWQNR